MPFPNARPQVGQVAEIKGKTASQCLLVLRLIINDLLADTIFINDF